MGIQVLIINASSLWFVRIRRRNYVSCSCMSARASPNHVSPLYTASRHTPTHAVTYRETCLWWSICRLSFVLPKCTVAHKLKYLWTIKVKVSLPADPPVSYFCCFLSDICFWSDYHNIVISLNAFNLAWISIQFHVWMQKHITFENHQRKGANDKQRQSVANCIIWDLNLPEKPHPKNSLPQQMYNPGWTSCQKF